MDIRPFVTKQIQTSLGIVDVEFHYGGSRIGMDRPVLIAALWLSEGGMPAKVIVNSRLVRDMDFNDPERPVTWHEDVCHYGREATDEILEILIRDYSSDEVLDDLDAELVADEASKMYKSGLWLIHRAEEKAMEARRRGKKVTITPPLPSNLGEG